MILYLAGNFPAMKKPELEQRYKECSLECCGHYNRLISFHFDPDIQTVLNLRRQEINGEEKIPIPDYCPACKNKLILKGEGYGFCDICVAEITWNKEE